MSGGAIHFGAPPLPGRAVLFAGAEGQWMLAGSNWPEVAVDLAQRGYALWVFEQREGKGRHGVARFHLRVFARIGRPGGSPMVAVSVLNETNPRVRFDLAPTALADQGVGS